MKIKKVIKSTLYKKSKLFNIHDLDANKILVSRKKRIVWYKKFFGYNDDDVIRPLCIKLPQMIGYVKNFDSNEAMPFKVGDKSIKKLKSKKYNKKVQQNY